MSKEFEDAEIGVSESQRKSEEILEITDFVFWYGERCLEMKQLEKRFIKIQKQLIGAQTSLMSLRQSQVDVETLKKEKEAAVKYNKSLEDSIHKVALERDSAHKQMAELKEEMVKLKRKLKRKTG